jgi:manganese/zinc/iron transport system substrate-binding protein
MPTPLRPLALLIPALLVPALLALLLAACTRPAPQPDAHSLRVVATTSIIADTARAIAGPRAAVTALMGEGVDPHTYKPSPGDVRLLADADLVLFNGLHLEGRMADSLERLAARQPVVAVTDRLDPALLLTPDDAAKAHDPHVWFDASLWSAVAGRIRDALIAADPEGTAHYTARAADFTAALAALHDHTAAAIATIPDSSRVLVTAHDAFAYFARAYSIEVLAIQGISTDSEASLRDINALVDTLVARRIPAVFIESSVPRKTIDALVEGAAARGHPVTVGGELYSDALGPASTPEGTYLGMALHNLRVITAALGGSASTVDHLPAPLAAALQPAPLLPPAPEQPAP